MERIPYSNLLTQYSDQKIPYNTLLCTLEWYTRREHIISRDQDQCTQCHNRTTEYLLGHHVWWLPYLRSVKEPNYKFWEKFDYYEKLLGDKFAGISASEEDYDTVVEPEEAAVTMNKQYYLQVHHKYYIESRLPWDYPDEALITFCNWCHFELHQRDVIPVYAERDGHLHQRSISPCPRCSGAGFFPEYKHVEDGVCFYCRGARYREYIMPV